MKHLKVSITSPVILSSSDHSSTTSGTKAVITSTEGWQISTSCRTDEGNEDREVTQIKIYTPGAGKNFTGTIQDISALPAILKNAYHEVMKVAENRFDDKKREQEVLDCAIELQNFMKLFE